METLLARHEDKASGTLNGLDRLRFRKAKQNNDLRFSDEGTKRIVLFT
jgi:hypothetical protein